MNNANAINGQWIWVNAAPEKNQYAVFKETFSHTGGKVTLKICAVSDYIAVVNGTVVAFGQYHGFDFEKYYDTADIGEYCKIGENEIKITVRYEGVNSLTSIAGKPGVIFSIDEDGKMLAASGTSTPSALSGEYVRGVTQNITWQLGLSSHMCCGGEESFEKSVLSEQGNCTLLPRPVKKCRLLAPIEAKLIDEKKRVYDLGAETVGYLHLKVNCAERCAITAVFGEHMTDGYVRRIIEERDFSLKFYCEKGENDFTQLFVRLGVRYIQLYSDGEVTSAAVELLPCEYPTEEKKTLISGLDKKIYDTCIKTLKCCMHEHYEDCPWREQALYILDSRNQMLCGYYAFDNASFARANLLLMSKGKMENGLLELTFPAVDTPSIPFFSIMYIVAVSEYVKYTGDVSLAESVMDTMKTIMTVFANRIDESGLIPNLEKPFWNFYEWNDGSEGVYEENGKRYDLILNCAYLFAVKHFKELCGGECDLSFDEEKMRRAIKATFYDEKEGAYFISTARKELFTDLGNAFAVLVGLGTPTAYEKIKSGTMQPATLSMLCYVYDALLMCDKGNAEHILNDIRKKYGYMLECGATTFWETLEGEESFGTAASLCHGWSAIPVYYYHILGVAKYA